MKIALIIILCLIIFILVHILISQLDDLCEYEKKINKAIEYLTSYECVNDILQMENPKQNKGLDEKTFNEIVNRHIKVEYKVLHILEREDKE